MTTSEWADRLPPRWANSLIDAVTTANWNVPMSRWDVFETLASYEGGLSAYEAGDLVKEIYGIDLRGGDET